MKTTIHNIIGSPVPYEDLLKNGGINLTVPTKKITESVPTLKIREVKEMQKGMVAGAIVAKVVFKP